MELLIGCDPEVFVWSLTEKRYVSAHGMVPGTKDKPHPYGTIDKEKGIALGAFQVDGMALEFNIHPCSNRHQFMARCTAMYDALRREMKPGFHIRTEPVADFTSEYLATVPEEAKLLGCDPDYNAWMGTRNEPPNGEEITFRTASGHIHIGWTKDADPLSEEHFENCRALIRQLDYYLGLPSLLWDGDNRRRALYGQAGAFRPKSYGVEYRVLSNRWLTDQRLMGWVYDATVKGVRDLHNGKSMVAKYGDLAQMLINDNVVDWREMDDKMWVDMNLNPIPVTMKQVA